ncbi:uncharacterized protein LOC110012602 [Sesamum indicum]|uniref:Uncharacterized protein LOC110012602 n=1 Tax=Sesamum indicum TaxID=4182 RepID=A0A8M8V920_SESIN|nr:uncharacterized protein LOC110012602 [Sesamum indicum]
MLPIHHNEIAWKERYKARLVAKGFRGGWKEPIFMRPLPGRGAFLRQWRSRVGTCTKWMLIMLFLEVEVYMKFPPNFRSSTTRKACRLRISLYGRKKGRDRSPLLKLNMGLWPSRPMNSHDSSLFLQQSESPMLNQPYCIVTTKRPCTLLQIPCFRSEQNTLRFTATLPITHYKKVKSPCAMCHPSCSWWTSSQRQLDGLNSIFFWTSCAFGIFKPQDLHRFGHDSIVQTWSFSREINEAANLFWLEQHPLCISIQSLSTAHKFC